MTCSLTLEGGVREKTFATIAGLNILLLSPERLRVSFTGTNGQKLILTDVAIEGSVPAILADNTFTAGTGTSQILITDCRLARQTRVRCDPTEAGSIECSRVDLWNRPGVGMTTSPTVSSVPDVARVAGLYAEPDRLQHRESGCGQFAEHDDRRCDESVCCAARSTS